MARPRFGVEGGKAAAPCFAHWRHVCIAVARAMVVVQHVVDPGNDRDLLVAVWLRHQPSNDCFQERPLLLRKKAPRRDFVERCEKIEVLSRRKPGEERALRGHCDADEALFTQSRFVQR